MQVKKSKQGISLWVVNFFGVGLALISSLFLIRLLVDTSFRVLYAFIPQISTGLEVSISVFSWLLLVRSSSAFLSPFFGSFADRYGRRKVMTFALLSQFVGVIGITLLKGWWVALPIFFSGLAVNSYLPAQQAYLSDLVSFDRRGRALASVDIAFAVSGIVMMPLIGWLFGFYGWQIPFLGLGILSVFAAWLTWRYLPEAKSTEKEPRSVIGMKVLLRERNIQASLGVAMLLFIGVGIFMTLWSIWLSADFGFDSVDLGLMATQIGLSELFGAILAGLIVDRLGKRRSSLMGVVLAAIFFSLIPLSGDNLFLVRLALIVTVFWVEYSIVSLFPLYGEQAPQARATIFALVALANGIGLAIGPVLTTALWEWQGLSAITFAAGGSLALCALLIVFFLKETVLEGENA